MFLLHGAGGQALLWGSVLAHLADLDAVALDLPGHGHSEGPASTDLAAYADAVAALPAELGLRSVVVAGHSMGGAIALALALRRPPWLRAVVLISVTARLFVTPDLLQKLVQDPAEARRWIVETGYGPATEARLRESGLQQLAQVPPEVLHQDFVACSRSDMQAHLRNVEVPALVLCGDQDRLTPLKHVRALAEGLPRATLRIVPGAGHMLPLERPDAVGAAVTAFVQGI
ncbi:MAG: alpha/beta fold hydrolase [Anaerolineae bacterium]